MTVPQRIFTILLVEDEPADAHLVRMAFMESRVLVDLRHVTDGVDALAYLEQAPGFIDTPRPDLILLDLNMPRMDGRTFLAELKRREDLRGIPVVVLTTSDVERDVVAAYDLGAAGYIVKPVDLDQFMSVIQSLQDYWITVVRIPER